MPCASPCPTARIVGLEAGVHCLLDVEDSDDTAAADQLAQQGITAMPLRACRHLPAGRTGLLLGYANLPSHHHSKVAEAVAAALTHTAPTNIRASDQSG